jgi:hypothetical protein
MEKEDARLLSSDEEAAADSYLKTEWYESRESDDDVAFRKQKRRVILGSFFISLLLLSFLSRPWRHCVHRVVDRICHGRQLTVDERVSRILSHTPLIGG